MDEHPPRRTSRIFPSQRRVAVRLDHETVGGSLPRPTLGATAFRAHLSFFPRGGGHRSGGKLGVDASPASRESWPLSVPLATQARGRHADGMVRFLPESESFSHARNRPLCIVWSVLYQRGNRHAPGWRLRTRLLRRVRRRIRRILVGWVVNLVGCVVNRLPSPVRIERGTDRLRFCLRLAGLAVRVVTNPTLGRGQRLRGIKLALDLRLVEVRVEGDEVASHDGWEVSGWIRRTIITTTSLKYTDATDWLIVEGSEPSQR